MKPSAKTLHGAICWRRWREYRWRCSRCQKRVFFFPSWRSGQGGALTQTQGCLSAWSAVILLAGLIVNIWLIRFLASGVTVSHSGEGNCEAQRKVIYGEATGKVAAMTLKHSIAYEMADNKKNPCEDETSGLSTSESNMRPTVTRQTDGLFMTETGSLCRTLKLDKQLVLSSLSCSLFNLKLTWAARAQLLRLSVTVGFKRNEMEQISRNRNNNHTDVFFLLKRATDI